MQHVDDGQDARRYTVSRVLALSPEQNELMRRNFSRIFILPMGEGALDSILFQGSRSIENFIGPAARAVSEAGLKTSIDLQLRGAFDAKLPAGYQSFIKTNGWVQDEKGEVYDLYIELDLQGEEGELPNMETYDAQSIEGMEFENPLCIKVGIEDLSPQWETTNQDATVDETPKPRMEPEVERAGGGQGQVKNPETDRRLKENRPEQLVSARQTQNRAESGESEGSSMERQAGKPGRVRFAALDGRLKRNRRPAMEGAGGR